MSTIIRNKIGLLSYLQHFKDQLESAPNDADFFLDLGRFMKTIVFHPLTKPLLNDLVKDKREYETKKGEANKELYQKMKIILGKLFKDKKFPVDDSYIQTQLNELSEKENGNRLSSEAVGITAYIAVLKILERLDELNLKELTKEWTIQDKDSLIRYMIYFDQQKYETAENSFKIESESTAWGAYSRLLLVPLAIFDSQQYFTEAQKVEEEYKKQPDQAKGLEVWNMWNLIGVYGEMKEILGHKQPTLTGKPVVFKRSEFFHDYLRLRTFLIGQLEGMSSPISSYDDTKTRFEVNGLLKIDPKNNFIKYMGVNGEREHQFILRLPTYTLLVELAKADDNKLSIDVLIKDFNDVSKCDKPPSPEQADKYTIVKYTCQYARNLLGLTPNELDLNKKTGYVSLNPTNK